jgi:hypothetical protein
LTIVLPSARSPASASQIGNNRLGLMQRNCLSRLRIKWLSSHARSRGPSVAGRGDGSRIVRCSVPPLTPGLIGTMVAVEEKGAGYVGDGGEGGEVSMR